MNKYNQYLDKNNANFVPLTPLSFLERAKDIYPNYEALVYENRNYTWSQVYERCIRFASALEKIGIGEGDTVSVMAFNTPEIFEAHYSVPMTGAILNTINIRLDVKTVSILQPARISSRVNGLLSPSNISILLCGVKVTLAVESP